MSVTVPVHIKIPKASEIVALVPGVELLIVLLTGPADEKRLTEVVVELVSCNVPALWVRFPLAVDSVNAPLIANVVAALAKFPKTKGKLKVLPLVVIV